MILFDFEYERPAEFEEAVTLLRDFAGRAQLLAGGTDLVPNMRVENVVPERLISLSGIATDDPEVLTDGILRLSALTRLAEIEHSPTVHDHSPMLALSAHVVGSNQTRQMGTLGGNLCQQTRCLYLNQQHDHQFVEPCYKRGGGSCYPFPGNAENLCWSVYMSDIAPALVALDASLDILGPTGSRQLPVAGLFSGDGMEPLTLGEAELIREVRVPALTADSGWGYRKLTVRGGLEYGMAVLSVMLTLDADGRTCREVRIVLGAIEQAPVRPARTEALLVGREIDSGLLAEVADQATDELRPLPHHGFTRKELRDAIRTGLRDALGDAAARARGDLA